MQLGAACPDVTNVCADVNAICVSGICQCKQAYFADDQHCRMYSLVCHVFYCLETSAVCHIVYALDCQRNKQETHHEIDECYRGTLIIA